MKNSEFRYLPVRPRDVQWGLHVSGAGWANIPQGSRYPPPGHPDLYEFTWERGRTLPEYQIVYIVNGAGTFQSATVGARLLTAGSLIMLFPGEWHRYRPTVSIGWEEMWVGFRGEQVDRLLFNRFFSPEQPIFEPGIQKLILSPFETLLDRMWRSPPGFPHLVAANVLEILAAILATTRQESHQLILQGPQDVIAVKDRVVNDALRIIWSETHTVLSVNQLAKRLGLSARSLERRFHESLQRTVRDELFRCRIDRAHRLLRDTDLTIPQIASSSGFSSHDALTRAIQKADGVTPIKLRKILRSANLVRQPDNAT